MSYAEPPGPVQFPAASSVTNGHCGFQRPERRSSRLPFDMNRSRFGTVSDGTNQQALASLSWLSYSRPSDFPTVPEPVTARSRASPRCELPTLARLNEPDGTLTRFARCFVALWPEPPGWDLHPLRRTRPCRTKERIARQGVSPSPRQLRDRIEREDYSENAEHFRDYFHEPPSNWTSTSPCIQLYG